MRRRENIPRLSLALWLGGQIVWGTVLSGDLVSGKCSLKALLPWEKKLRVFAIRSRPMYLGRSAPMKHDTVSELFGIVSG